MRIKRMVPLLLILSGAAVFVLGGIFLVMNSRQETIELTDEVRKEAPGKFIQLENGLVHYSLQGNDSAKVIILIHGGGGPGMEVWSEVAPYLIDKGFRVLMYDLYGRGYSDYPRIANTPELFHQQLTQLIDTLQLRPPFNIVTMSMGAIITLDYMHQYPQNINKIVFIDPAATGDFKLKSILKIPVVSDFLMTTYWYPRSVESQRKEFVNPAIFERYAERLRYFTHMKGFKSTNYSTWVHLFPQNKLPLLSSFPQGKAALIYGMKDPYFSAEQAERYKEVYPSLKVISIDSAGHLPHMERPQIVNEVILDFLQRSN